MMQGPGPGPFTLPVPPHTADRARSAGAAATLSSDAPHPRHVALDTVRGAMLVMMAANHIPTDLQRVTNHPLGYVSAAEGFVFLAGLLCGLVYTRRYEELGPSAATAAALRRARTVYLAHLACLAAVAVWVWLYQAFSGAQPPGAPPLLGQRPLAALAAGAALIYQPGLLDILPLYCGFLLLLPVVLWQLQGGRAERVLVFSFGWWALTNVFDAQQPYTRGLINTGAFNFGAWQLLFVAGVVFGHRWAHGRARPPSIPRAALAFAVAIAALLAVTRHVMPHLGGAPSWLHWLTNKNNLAPVRLVNIALLFYLLSLAITTWPRFFGSRALAFLGQSSLAVFSVHVVVATVILAFPGFFEHTPAGRWLGPLLLGSAMCCAALIAQRPRATAGVSEERNR